MTEVLESTQLLGWMQIFAAFVTACATIALWYVTRVLAIETRFLAQQSNKPFLVYYLRSSESSSIAMNQVIVNTGTGTAFDIIARMTPPLPKFVSSQKDAPTERKVSLLPPSREITFAGAMGNKIADQEYDVEISWATSPKSKERQSLTYKIEAADGFDGGFNAKGMHQLVTEIEKLRGDLKASSQSPF